MSWRESRLGKVWASLARYGIYRGLQDAATRWLRNRARIPEDVLGDYGWILTADHPASRPLPASGPFEIAWLLPTLGGQGGGGLLNIFRTIQQFESWGHRQHIYVVGTRQSAEFENELARKYYFPIRSQIEILTGQVADSDALIATNWVTAYAARGIANTSRKFYFVQDLEHLFYPEGSLAEFAKQTYRFGFRGITLGDWIAAVLRHDYGMDCRPFGFSYDREIYSPEGSRRYGDGEKRVVFYARPSTERRGFELGILAFSLVAKAMPEVKFVLVGFPPQSIRLPFPAEVAGILSTAALAALYRDCTVALVLSHTNLSLLPLELMACGCAVVSNSGANVEWLLSADTAQLAEPNPQALAEAMLSLLRDDRLRESKAAAALAFAQRTDWIAAIKTIEDALYEGLNIPANNRQRG